MKLMYKFILAGAALMALASCNKENIIAETPGNGGEIIFNIDNGFDAVVTTKATAITSVPTSLYWAATSGTRGTTSGTSIETKKWDDKSSTAATVSSSKISTGKFQTATPTAYNYYVANSAISVPATGAVTMSIANNNTDVVAGYVAANSSLNPSIALGHIFARTGTLTASAASGYTISGVSWKIVGKSTINGTAGTYNLSTGAWSAASTKLSTATAVTSSSDMYLIPGTYTVTVTFTLTKGDWHKQYTKSADVVLAQGKINNISGSFDGEASEIILSVSVTAWTNNNLAPEFS